MPRMGKRARSEWSMFIGPTGRRRYNRLCRKCRGDCKQSFRATVIECPKYHSKREKCCEKVRI